MQTTPLNHVRFPKCTPTPPPFFCGPAVCATQNYLVALSLQANVHVQAINPPLSLTQQTPQPLQPDTGPLGPGTRNLVGRGAHQRVRGGIEHIARKQHGGVGRGGDIFEGIGRGGRRGGKVGDARARLEPVAAQVEEAAVGPVARGHKEDEEEEGAVDAGSIEEVGADEEEEDEGGRGVGGDEEEGEPAGRVVSVGNLLVVGGV